MNANGRRVRQANIGYRHISGLRRPRYPATSNRSIAESIEAERKKAQRMNAAKGKKK